MQINGYLLLKKKKLLYFTILKEIRFVTKGIAIAIMTARASIIHGPTDDMEVEVTSPPTM